MKWRYCEQYLKNENKDGYLHYVVVQGVQLKTETKRTEGLQTLHFLGVINNLPVARIRAENYLQLSDVLDLQGTQKSGNRILNLLRQFSYYSFLIEFSRMKIFCIKR